MADRPFSVLVTPLPLSDLIAAVAAGTAESPLGTEERFGLMLGISCHAIYHAGQVQLIERLHGE